MNDHGSTTQGVYLGNSEESDATNLIRLSTLAPCDKDTQMPLSSSQTITYKFSGSPGGTGAFIDVSGYRFVR